MVRRLRSGQAATDGQSDRGPAQPGLRNVRRLLRTCCHEDVEFVPPDERPVIRGVEELITHVSGFTANWPGDTNVSLARPVESHHGTEASCDSSSPETGPVRAPRSSGSPTARSPRLSASLILRPSSGSRHEVGVLFHPPDSRSLGGEIACRG